MDDPHYACPPLARWLPALAVDGCGVSCVGPIPRALRPLLDPFDTLGPESTGLGLVVVVGLVVDADGRDLLGALRPGGWLVELLPVSPGLARALFALRSDASRVVEAGSASARKWAQLGLCALQQWASVDPPDILVTCGRRA